MADAASSVAFDAVDLVVEGCSIADPSGSCDVTWRIDDGRLILESGRRLAGECETEIIYTGSINDLMAGFYRSRYVLNGQTRFLAITQFEERDARRAFPCVDHPAAKAVFNLEILAPIGHVAIANTPVIGADEQPDGRRLFRFESTPPMSTYLVFFAVGPFDVEVDTSWRIPIGVAVSPGQGAAARKSLEYARKSITYLEELVGIPYPLGKLDSIGVTDFAFGAMENFGAISYRENLLLTNEGSTTRGEVERMMGVAAHEIAHMWFGDLVSPAGWRYVWLNEAFATYFGNLATAHWYPEWRTIARFASESMGGAMARDGLPGTVPIELERDEVEIDASTAPIVYQKGACVLRMFHEFFGDTAFRRATTSFLSAFQFSAVDTQGFLTEFGRALDLAEDETADSATGSAGILDRWIRTPGFPLVRVSRRDGKVRIRQERFSYTNDRISEVSGWTIPITAITADGPPDRIRLLLGPEPAQIDLPTICPWLKLNRDQSGYYRVFYEDPEAWDTLGRAAAIGDLGPLDRYGLIADLGAFTLAGMVDIDRYLGYLGAYAQHETDPIVVAEIASSLGSLHALLPHDDRVSVCARALLTSHRNALLAEPSNDEPYDAVLLREPVLWTLALFGDDVVIGRLVEWARMIRSGATVHADAVPLALRVAVATDPSFVGWILSRLDDKEVPEGRAVQLVGSLAAVRDREGIETVLSYVIDTVPYRNRLHFLRPAASNPQLHPRLWQWFTDNFDDIAGIHPYHLGSTVSLVVPTGGLGRETEVTSFLEQYLAGDPRIDRGVVELALDRLEVNRRLIERES